MLANPIMFAANHLWSWTLVDVINAVIAGATLLLLAATFWYNRRALRLATDANKTALEAAMNASGDATEAHKET